MANRFHINDIFDEIIARYLGLRHSLLKVLRPFETFLRWCLFTVTLFYIGNYSKFWLDKYFNGQLQSIVAAFKLLTTEKINVIIYFSCVGGWIWGTVSRVKVSRKELNVERIFYALRWFYNDLDFDKDVDTDVRCTLWSPQNSKVPLEKMRLEQVVDYVPAMGKYTNKFNSFRLNGKRGRIQKVAKISNRNIKPIGIIGLCALKTLNNKKPVVLFESIPNDMNFIEYMTNPWNFSKAQAKRLTSDRMSYMCLSLMNAARTDLLGIIYLDARKPDFFTQTMGNRAQEYLPRIAELLIGS